MAILKHLTNMIVCTMGYLPTPERPHIRPKQAPIPLKSVHYEVKISSPVAEVSLIQNYKNPTASTIDVFYRFPINKNLVFSQFWAKIGKNKKWIRGEIREKNEAKRIYEANLKQGNTVSRAYIAPEEKDVMRVQLGNLAPKESIQVKLTYLVPLEVAGFTKWGLRVPSTLTPKYVSRRDLRGIKDWRLRHFVKTHPANYVHKRYTWKIDVLVDWPNIGQIASKTHSKGLEVINEGLGQLGQQIYRARIGYKRKEYPDTDFELIIENKHQFEPEVTINRLNRPKIAKLGKIQQKFGPKNQKFYRTNLPVYGATLYLIPPLYAWKAAMEAADRSTLKMKISKNSKFDKNEFLREREEKYQEIELEKVSKASKSEFVFIIDKSGSMNGKRIFNAKKALKIFLRSLPGSSYFNVIAFSNNFSPFFKKSRKSNFEQISSALAKIDRIQAGGGTELFPAFEFAAKLKKVKNFDRKMFVLTDGAIYNPDRLLTSVRAYAASKSLSVYSIGVGNGASQYLVKGLAEAGNGVSEFISDSQDPRERITGLLLASMRPVLTDFYVSFNRYYISGMAPFLGKNSIVRAGKPLMINVLLNEEAVGREIEVNIAYFDTGRKTREYASFRLDLEDQSSLGDSTAPFKLFTKTMLEEKRLTAKNPDFGYFEKSVFLAPWLASNPKINLEMALGYGVVDPEYTSFVCVVQKNEKNSKSKKAKKTLFVPNLVSSDYGNGVIGGGGGIPIQNPPIYYRRNFRRWGRPVHARVFHRAFRRGRMFKSVPGARIRAVPMSASGPIRRNVKFLRQKNRNFGTSKNKKNRPIVSSKVVLDDKLRVLIVDLIADNLKTIKKPQKTKNQKNSKSSKIEQKRVTIAAKRIINQLKYSIDLRASTLAQVSALITWSGARVNEDDRMLFIVWSFMKVDRKLRKKGILMFRKLQNSVFGIYLGTRRGKRKVKGKAFEGKLLGLGRSVFRMFFKESGKNGVKGSRGERGGTGSRTGGKRRAVKKR